MNIKEVLNELLVKLFRDITEIEEKAIKTGPYKNMTVNDMHVIEAIGTKGTKNMSAVAKGLDVTTGTLTIAVNALVKKGYVDRVRSEEDRRVVLVSLTKSGRDAHAHHKKFHDEMIERIMEDLSPDESKVLEKTLSKFMLFFDEIKNK